MGSNTGRIFKALEKCSAK